MTFNLKEVVPRRQYFSSFLSQVNEEYKNLLLWFLKRLSFLFLNNKIYFIVSSNYPLLRNFWLITWLMEKSNMKSQECADSGAESRLPHSLPSSNMCDNSDMLMNLLQKTPKLYFDFIITVFLENLLHRIIIFKN